MSPERISTPCTVAAGVGAGPEPPSDAPGPAAPPRAARAFTEVVGGERHRVSWSPAKARRRWGGGPTFGSAPGRKNSAHGPTSAPAAAPAVVGRRFTAT